MSNHNYQPQQPLIESDFSKLDRINAPERDKYHIILADPSWIKHQKGKHGATDNYPLMTMDRIHAMANTICI